MLSKGLQARKKKSTAFDESTAKKARMNTSSSGASVDAIVVTKVAATAWVGAIIEGSMPPSSTSPPVEDPALWPPTGREEGKKKEKKIIMKVHHKACFDESNDDGDNLREDPFSNLELIRDLIDKFAMPEVVDHMADLDYTQLI
ncbi:putative ensconsin-like [Cocos nucifera]|uniref:Putative ensconsin-like n=1 Tax=Cocos nucifera TaxID=13894 RepID=A0A8K0IP64_COCNU|nr:putative ensconsin-like [Cocos nucifera]